MDDTITNATATSGSAASTTTKDDGFDKEAWAAGKQAERRELFARTDAITERVATDPQALKGALRIMARFPSYSVSNALLIYDQAPDATSLGDSNFWRKKGAQIKQGITEGILIRERAGAYERDDGSIGTSYEIKSVYDIRQTTARPRKHREPDMRSLLNALAYDKPHPTEKSTELPEGKDALYDKTTETIRIREGLGERELFCALATGMAEAALAESTAQLKGGALMAAYVVFERYGVNTAGLEPTLAGLPEGLTPKEIRTKLGEVKGAAKGITARMDAAIEHAKAAREKEQAR